MSKSAELGGSEGRACWVTRYVGVSMVGRLEPGGARLAAASGREGWVKTEA